MEQLEAAGLAITVVPADDAVVAAGVVLGQGPELGSELEVGAPVRVLVAP